MKKHASSHGLAVLICTITGGVLVKMGYDHYRPAADMLRNISLAVIDMLNLDTAMFSVDAVSTLLLAIALAVIWGAAFALMHSDK